MNRHLMPRPGQGFGLLETVIYIGISAVLVVVLHGFLANVLGLARKTVSVSDADYAMRLTTMRLLHEVRSASTGVDGSSTFASDDGQLTLTTVTGTVAFHLSPTRALLVTDASGTSALTPSGVSLTVFRVEPVAVTSAGSPRSLRFVLEADTSDAAPVRSEFTSSLR